MTPAPKLPWAWVPATLWRCPRCLSTYLVREMGARCRRCGYREDE